MPMQLKHNTLKQRHWLFGTREFIIQDAQCLLVREKSLWQSHESTVPLSLLNPNPSYSSSFAIRWLFNSLLMGGLALLVLLLAYQKSIVILYPLALILLVTTLVLLYRFFLYTTRLVIFRHRYSDENFLYFWRDNPNKTAFRKFTRELRQLIKYHHQ